MGVPTVTLAGSNYVSRMSTAVLTGAGMNDWIAHDYRQYVRLATDHAIVGIGIRNNRSFGVNNQE